MTHLPIGDKNSGMKNILANKRCQLEQVLGRMCHRLRVFILSQNTKRSQNKKTRKQNKTKKQRVCARAHTKENNPFGVLHVYFGNLSIGQLPCPEVCLSTQWYCIGKSWFSFYQQVSIANYLLISSGSLHTLWVYFFVLEFYVAWTCTGLCILSQSLSS